MAQYEAGKALPLHPKVATAGAATIILGAVFSILAAVGVVVPEDLQNTASIAVADVAALIPLLVAYLKSA